MSSSALAVVTTPNWDPTEASPFEAPQNRFALTIAFRVLLAMGIRRQS